METPAPDSALDVESLWKLFDAAGIERHVPDPLIGRDLGGVRVIRMIAEGGMGRVYEGVQQSPARTVAVKVLRPGLLSRAVYRRFAQETAILGGLHHSAIAQIHTAGTFTLLDAPIPFFVMEYVPRARPITEHVRHEGLDHNARLDLFAVVIDAIAHGHSLGVIHRDLKPGNILVAADGRPKVIDFGVARGAGCEDSSALTLQGEILGSLQAMSPEQVLARPSAVDARADVYSLGVVLYEVLTDTPPYDVRDKSVVEAARIIQEHKPPPIHEHAPQIPRRVSRVVARCLAKDPADRFANAGELLAALQQARTCQSPQVVRRFGLPFAVAAGMLALLGLSVTPPRTASSLARGLPRGTPRHAGRLTEFRYTTIDEADHQLVTADGVRKYREWQTPPRSYWGPERNDQPGELVYRFDFPGRTRAIHLLAETSCWDFSKSPGGLGRGAAALEISADGSTWLEMRNGLTPPRWGVSWHVDEPVPAAACGTDALWVRVRLLTQDAPNVAYTTAQFGRCIEGGTTPVFGVFASLAEKSPVD
jgi:hypothetical protein